MEKEINIAEIAELSMLSCDFKDPEKIKKDMEQMIEFAGVVKKESANNIQPLPAKEQESNIFRDDVPGEALKRDALLEIAPKTKDGYIYVPTVVERE